MKVEIWSDVVCPFCYIGKRKFESALEKFPHKDEIEIEWKSYQLSPKMKTEPSKNVHQYLAEHKGISLDEAKAMNEEVTRMAAENGLTYNFDKTIVANSFTAHRFSHFAKQYAKQNEAEELLFRAYFTEGKNIDDIDTLAALGTQLGLTASTVKETLKTTMFSDDVHMDIYEASQVGAQGVPFFVFDNKYAISGAQDSSLFLQTLEKAFAEHDPNALNR
jgi:predicted DsbA family dithiol-disulfide isomerase